MFCCFREILRKARGLDGRDREGDVAVAEHAKPTQLLGGGLRGAALVVGRGCEAGAVNDL